MPACITSIRRIYRYGFCEKVIFAKTSLRPFARGNSRIRLLYPVLKLLNCDQS